MNKYECQIKALSPVHIGSGDKYNASEYINSKARSKKTKEILKTINRIDTSRYFLSLDENIKDEFLRQLSDSNFNLGDFNSKISNEFRIYQAINKSQSEIKASQDITEAVKTLNQIYIPGSSIKGAIKSAILYRQIDDDMIRTISKKVIGSRNRVDRREYTRFLNSIFTSRKAKTPAQGDIMKFLQVSDTSTSKIPAVYDILTVMASFNIGHNEYYKKNKKSNSPTLSYLESIDKGSKLSFEIKNNYDYDVFKRLGLQDKKDLIDIENIKKSIFIFSKALIKHEIEFADDYNISYLSKFYSNLENINSMDNPVLKVGAGSGFLSTTVGLKIKNYDPFLFDKIADGTRGKTYTYSFPKSRKVTKKGGMPLGWVQLSFKEV